MGNVDVRYIWLATLCRDQSWPQWSGSSSFRGFSSYESPLPAPRRPLWVAECASYPPHPLPSTPGRRVRLLPSTSPAIHSGSPSAPLTLHIPAIYSGSPSAPLALHIPAVHSGSPSAPLTLHIHHRPLRVAECASYPPHPLPSTPGRRVRLLPSTSPAVHSGSPSVSYPPHPLPSTPGRRVCLLPSTSPAIHSGSPSAPLTLHIPAVHSGSPSAPLTLHIHRRPLRLAECASYPPHPLPSTPGRRVRLLPSTSTAVHSGSPSAPLTLHIPCRPLRFAECASYPPHPSPSTPGRHVRLLPSTSIAVQVHSGSPSVPLTPHIHHRPGPLRVAECASYPPHPLPPTPGRRVRLLPSTSPAVYSGSPSAPLTLRTLRVLFVRVAPASPSPPAPADLSWPTHCDWHARFKAKYHPEECVKRQQEQIANLKVSALTAHVELTGYARSQIGLVTWVSEGRWLNVASGLDAIKLCLYSHIPTFIFVYFSFHYLVLEINLHFDGMERCLNSHSVFFRIAEKPKP